MADKMLCCTVILVTIVSFWLNIVSATTRDHNVDKYSENVRLTVEEDHVVMENGIVKITLSNPQGEVRNVSYMGIENITKSGYWDLNWSKNTTSPLISDKVLGENFRVIVETEEQVELSFSREWDPSKEHTSQVPINIDKRYILLKGSSGFYAYGIYERPDGFPACVLVKTRMVIRLNEDRFQNMMIGENKSRVMPRAEDRLPPRGVPLAYKEAVLLKDPTNPDLRGEVDDKYQYSLESQEGRVHGWFSIDPKLGFWIIFPSIEFRNGGPTKQYLTSHTGPLSLVIWQSGHYMTRAYCKFAYGETWQKVFGPVYIYLNLENDNKSNSLFEDANQQKLIQEQMWPYNFPNSSHFLKKDERSTVSGRFLVHDRFLSSNPFPADSAYIGLAAAGKKGSWQNETKGYQFWMRTDATGYFSISNVRPGKYNVYGWVPKIMGDYMNDTTITIGSGSFICLQDLVFNPPRNGSTIWEIGIPDRSAGEFFVPAPPQEYINRLYLNDPENRFRQYGLWEKYTELYPENDLIFTIGKSYYTKDWFFAHVTRKNNHGLYVPTTWEVKFQLLDFMWGTNFTSSYTLHIAVAASQNSILEVRFNEMDVEPPHFAINLDGKDNAIARHGIHGTYQLISFVVQSQFVKKGNNTIFLTQSLANGPFNGILYDYIRMERNDLQYQ